MPFVADEAEARCLMTLYRGWFGSPVVKRGGKVVDGTKRLAAWRALCFAGDPPTVEAKTSRDVCRLLCAAHHYDRAADMLGAMAEFGADLPAVLHLPAQLCAPLVALVRKRS